MPRISSVAEGVRQGLECEGYRTVVLYDQDKDLGAYARFAYPYDHDANLSVVTSLFDESLNKLVETETKAFSSEKLPLIASVGRWEVTVIQKKGGQVTIQDGSGAPVDCYLGVGG